MLSRLDTIAEDVSAACQKVRVGEVHIIDDGSGTTLPRYAAAYPNMVAEVLRSLYASCGVDILEVVGATSANGDNEDSEEEE